MAYDDASLVETPIVLVIIPWCFGVFFLLKRLFFYFYITITCADCCVRFSEFNDGRLANREKYNCQRRHNRGHANETVVNQQPPFEPELLEFVCKCVYIFMSHFHINRQVYITGRIERVFLLLSALSF